MSAVEVLTQHQLVDDWPRRHCICGKYVGDLAEQLPAHQFAALKAAGYKVIAPIKFSDLTDEEIDSMNAALNGDPT